MRLVYRIYAVEASRGIGLFYSAEAPSLRVTRTSASIRVDEKKPISNYLVVLSFRKSAARFFHVYTVDLWPTNAITQQLWHHFH